MRRIKMERAPKKVMGAKRRTLKALKRDPDSLNEREYQQYDTIVKIDYNSRGNSFGSNTTQSKAE